MNGVMRGTERKKKKKKDEWGVNDYVKDTQLVCDQAIRDRF